VSKIDFYVLSEHAPNGRLLLACRLAEKAYLRGHTVHIETASPDQARTLDRLLWTFRAGSFMPHCVCPKNVEAAPVTIGWRDNPGMLQRIDKDPQHRPKVAEATPHTVLINLSQEIPACFERYARVCEVVDQQDHILRASRLRFRDYRDSGFDPTTHRL
jgi:DNA polymerase-3 subunit chi